MTPKHSSLGLAAFRNTDLEYYYLRLQNFSGTVMCLSLWIAPRDCNVMSPKANSFCLYSAWQLEPHWICPKSETLDTSCYPLQKVMLHFPMKAGRGC